VPVSDDPVVLLDRIVKDLLENKHDQVPVWRTQTVVAKVLLCCGEVALTTTPLYANACMKEAANKLLLQADCNKQDEKAPDS
jgi:hypothetical protein